MEVYVQVVGDLQENCYVVASSEKNAAIIDPGDDAPAILNLLSAHGLTPKLILLTHGHFDHIGAVNDLKEQYNVTVCANLGDKDYLNELSAGRAAFYRLSDRDRFVVSPDRWIGEGDLLTLDELEFQVIETPGHSQGSVCLLCGDAMFSGDTLFAGDIGRCDLKGGNYEVMKQTLQRLKKLDRDYRVLPGHGPSSSLDVEKRRNPYLTGAAL